MSPIWSIQRATSFHEVVEASYSDPSIIRNKDCDLPRRYSDYASESSGDHEDIPHAHWSFGKSGVHNQTREMNTLPNSRTGLPGSPAEFQRDDLSCTTGEVPKPSDRVCKSGEKAEMLNARVVSNDCPNEPNDKDWPLGSSFALPCIRNYTMWLHKIGYRTRSQQIQIGGGLCISTFQQPHRVDAELQHFQTNNDSLLHSMHKWTVLRLE